MNHIGERHIKIGVYLKDIIFAANDGIVTTFAVVAGVVGASLSPAVILIIGFVSLIADGFSMATGNYLGTKSEKEFYEKEMLREQQEVENIPNKEKEEIRHLLASRGYHGKDLDELVRIISSNKNYWVEFMLHHELGLTAPKNGMPIKHAAATFVSFVAAGSIPLIPYAFQYSSFTLSAVMTAIALFIVGAARTYFSGKSWFFSGLEMLLIGGSAATLAYLTGFGLSTLIG